MTWDLYLNYILTLTCICLYFIILYILNYKISMCFLEVLLVEVISPIKVIVLTMNLTEEWFNIVNLTEEWLIYQ